MKTVMLVFGTRPEAIKMCPLAKELASRSGIRTVVCVTGQHRQMLDGVLRAFDVTPEYDLCVMRHGQDLFDITAKVLLGMKEVIRQVAPDVILVHGDTTTAFAAALAGFYMRIPVGHIEAGLRTHDIYSPYPEEFNRRGISVLSTYNFAPTDAAKDNLIREGITPEGIHVTGNTVIDALRTTVVKNYSHPLLEWVGERRLILLTAHRRENLGEPMRNIFGAVRRVALACPDVRVIYPMHPNPRIKELAASALGGCESARICEPLAPLDFHNFIARSYMILTDSGGVQEEATALGIPTLVLRDTTERTEGVAAGALRLVGTDEDGIYSECMELLRHEEAYSRMARQDGVYGDGFACRRIADILESELFEKQ